MPGLHRRARALALLSLAPIALRSELAPALPADGSTLAGDRGTVSAPAGAGESVEPDLFHGAVTFGVPIAATPGTGGLQPELALRYSSAARADSWVGNGWSLGLSTISRSLARGTPAYDDLWDRFELDGEPLVRDAVDPARWHTRRERFLRVVREADDSWTVTRRDGLRLRFGSRPDARVGDGAGRILEWHQSEAEDLHGNVVVARYDRRDPGTAYLAEVRYTLRRRSDGGLASLDGDPARDRVVSFTLGPRPDAPTSRLAGFTRTLGHRLERIDVRAGGELVRRYELRFAQSPDSGRSLLASVALYGSDADGARPTPPHVTSFRYRTNAGVPDREGFARDPGWSAAWPPGLALVEADRRDAGTRLADVDGDGLPDLVKALGIVPAGGGDVALAPGSGVRLNTGSGFAAAPSPKYALPVARGVTGNAIPLTVAWRLPDGTTWGNGMTPADVTGDGRADFVGAIGFVPSSSPGYSGPLAQSYQGPWCRSTASGFECLPFTATYQDGSAFTGKQGLAFDASSLAYRFTFLGGNVQLADLSGDGLPELVVRGRDVQLDDRLQCRHQSSYSYVAWNWGRLAFLRSALSSVPVPASGCAGASQAISASHQPCDLAGDPTCPQRLFHNTTQIVDGFANGVWTFAGHQELGSFELDLDGDGLADFVSATLHGGADLRTAALNDGRGGYVPAPEWRMPVHALEVAAPPSGDFGSGGRSIDLGVRFADVNGDGRLDIVTGREGASPPSAVWLSDGDADEATAPGPWIAQVGSPWALPSGLAFVTADGQDLGVRIVDVDGDGMPDVVRSIGGASEVWRSRGAVPDLLAGVTGPEGGDVRLEYTPSTRFDHRGSDDAPDLPQVLQVLTAIETWDGASTPSRVSLSYDGGVFDADARELRGFRRVAATLPDGRRTITTFHQDEARAGLVESVLRLDAAGLPWEETRHEYTPDDDGAAPWVSLHAATTRIDHGGGAASPRRTRVELRYDGGGPIVAGNPTARIEYGEVGPTDLDLDPADTRVTEIAYARANEALHLLDRVKRRRLLQGAGPAALVLRDTQLFYDGDTTGAGTPGRGLVTLERDLLHEAGQPDAETAFGWDVYGNLISVTSPRVAAGQGGGTTSFEIDGRFHTFPRAVVNAVGHRTELDTAADPTCPLAHPAGAGLVQVERGPNELAAGGRTIRCHDAFGRIVRERGPLGLFETTFTYVDLAGATRISRADRSSASGSVRARVSYLDGFGREVRVEASGPGGRTIVTERAFDASGRLARESAPAFAGDPPLVTHSAYDPLDRVIEVRLPDGRAATTLYAPRERRRVDPDGRTVVYRLDAFDRVTAVEETDGPAPLVTRYVWSAADELVRVIDARGNVVQIVWDRLGRRRLLVDPDAGAVAFTWDAAGNLLAREDAAGRVEWSYDALDRTTRRRVGGATDATWTWDTAVRGLGRLGRRTDPAGAYEASVYFPDGQPFAETHTRQGVTLPFATTYDALGQTASRTYPSGRTVEWVRDASGFLTAIRSSEPAPQVYAHSIEWDARGRLARWTAGNGVATEASFDPSTGRLDTLEFRSPEGGPLERLRYRYDAADRVTAIDDLDAPARSRSFAYDAIGRLVRATGPFGAGAAPATLRSAYDAIGNLTCLDASDLAGCAGGRAFVYPGAGAPRPHAPLSVDGVPVGHSGAGALESFGPRRYAFDALGQLIAAFDGDAWLLTQRYDASGRRARVVTPGERRTTTLELVAPDFDWDETRGLGHVHVHLGGVEIATATDRFAPRASAPSAAVGLDPRHALVAASGLAAALLALHLARLARRGSPLARPAVAGATSLAVALLAASPLKAWPDGDLDGNGVLDAADALRAFEIARGARAPGATELAHGDVAPLEGAPETPPSVNGGDVALLLRALAGDDVDGDGLGPEGEASARSSPFRADTDRDGLSDAAEVAAGSDASASDTDGDGLADGAEAAAGSDPLDADTDGDGQGDASDPEPTSGVRQRHADALGSSVWVTGAGGAVLERVVYRPFGARVPSTPQSDASPPDPGFAGGRAVARTGLYDFGARVYDPALGRFLQPDPRVPDPLDPQALHRYAYAGNDPLRRVDPTGESSFFATLFGAVATALSGVASGDDAESLANLGVALAGFGGGSLEAGVTVRSDGRVLLDVGGLILPPTIGRRYADALSPPSDEAPLLAVAHLQFGDLLLTRDGGSAPGIALVPGMRGYGHGAFVLDVAAPYVRVASSDDRGRYVADNHDPAVGGRVWYVFRTGEPLDADAVRARLRHHQETGGLNGGVRQYLDDGGANVCTSFATELYRAGQGRRLPLDLGRLVSPGEVARTLGPPIGKVEIPLLTLVRPRGK